MTVLEITTLIIGIITIGSIVLFMCSLEDKKTLTPNKAQSFLFFTCFLSTLTGIFIDSILYERTLDTTPTVLDVYRDKTTLNINVTYQNDSIIQKDSTVLYKSF